MIDYPHCSAPVVPERAINRNCRPRVMVPMNGSVATPALATPQGAKYATSTSASMYLSVRVQSMKIHVRGFCLKCIRA